MVLSCFRLDFDIHAQHIGSKTGNNLHTIENLNSLSAFENLNKVMDIRGKYNTLFRPDQELCNTLKDLTMASLKDQFKIFLHVIDFFEKRITFIPSIITSSMTSESD